MGQSIELRHERVEAVTFDESARARDANPDSGGSAVRHRTHETNRHATVATIGRGVRAVRAPIGVTPRGHGRRVGRAQRDTRRAARA